VSGYGNWGEGGANRIALHVAGGALIGGLGGGSIGSAFQGAAGAGLSAAMAKELNSLSKGIKDETGSALLGNLAANVVAGVGGALVGGGVGATTAANVDLYNRQLHPEEKKAIADAGNGDQAEQDKLTRAACYAVKCWAEFAPGSAEYSANYVSQLEASQLGPELAWVNAQKADNLFVYTPLQQAGDAIKATVPSTRLPDFVNFQLDYFVGSVWGTFSRDGNSFFGYGVNMGIPNSVGASASVQLGWLNQASVSAGQVNKFLSDYSGNASTAFATVGGGVVYSPGNGTATTIGVGAGVNLGNTKNPGVVGMGNTYNQGETGLRW
jgi:filamentous hemagglutinin